jgi:type VI protein secretion system component Hcp
MLPSLWNRISRRRPHRQPARSPARLGVEQLEGRLVPATVAAQGLLIDGIAGPYANGEMAVDSYQWSETHSSNAGAKVSLGKFQVSLPLSAATPALLKMAMDGKVAKKAVLTERVPLKDGLLEKLRFTLENVAISSFLVTNLGEQISLSFSRIEERYTRQLPDGSTSITASWDGRTGHGSISTAGKSSPAKTDAPVGLSIPGIPSEFHNGNAIDSYSFSESNSSGRSPVLQDFHLRFKTGTLSPYVLLYTAEGAKFSSMDLTVYAATVKGQVQTVDFRLENVHVTSYATQDGMDDITLNFRRVVERATPLLPRGQAETITASWDQDSGSGSISNPGKLGPATGEAPVGLLLANVPGEYRNGSAVDSYSVTAGPGADSPHEFHVHLKSGLASPYLLVGNNAGRVYQTADLTILTATGDGKGRRVTWKFSDVRVTEYTTADGYDDVTFTFGKISLV